jgi:hypothetical protein
MNKKIIQIILPVIVLAVNLGGCSTPKRVLTSSLWNDQDDSHAVYLSYWEGKCRAKIFGGCSRGDSHVKYCSAQPDNSLKCEDVSELDTLLAR